MSATITIRHSRPSDIARILKIEQASFGVDAYDRKLFANFQRKCGDLFLIALFGGNVCGYMITCIGGKSLPASAELVSIAVDPKRRGKGVASALMDSTLRRLRRRGISRFRLIVKVTNHGAFAFYEKYGFAKKRIVPRYYEDGSDGWLMARG